MQVISLDTSLNSTAAVVFDKNSDYHFFNWRKDLNIDNVWNQTMIGFCKMQDVTYETSTDFSTSEVLKLQDYFALSTSVFKTLSKHIDESEPTIVLMEGYSQGSMGKDHDLVCLGTMIRLKFFSHYNSMIIVPPTSLKKHAAQLVYQPDKKGMYRNNSGVAGGSFNKFEMGQALVDLNSQDALSQWYIKNWDDIKDRASIPKPADDLADALWLNLAGQRFYYRNAVNAVV